MGVHPSDERGEHGEPAGTHDISFYRGPASRKSSPAPTTRRTPSLRTSSGGRSGQTATGCSTPPAETDASSPPTGTASASSRTPGPRPWRWAGLPGPASTRETSSPGPRAPASASNAPPPKPAGTSGPVRVFSHAGPRALRGCEGRPGGTAAGARAGRRPGRPIKNPLPGKGRGSASSTTLQRSGVPRPHLNVTLMPVTNRLWSAKPTESSSIRR